MNVEWLARHSDHLGECAGNSGATWQGRIGKHDGGWAILNLSSVGKLVHIHLHDDDGCNLSTLRCSDCSEPYTESAAEIEPGERKAK